MQPLHHRFAAVPLPIASRQGGFFAYAAATSSFLPSPPQSMLRVMYITPASAKNISTDPISSEGVRLFSVLIGCLVSAGLFYAAMRERANKVQYGANAEPLAFFAIKNLILSLPLRSSISRTCWPPTRGCLTC